MNLPARYQNVKAADAPKEILVAFNAIQKTRRGIYMYGEVGTGKTHILFALAKSAEGSSTRIVFRNTTELLRDIRQDFDRQAGDKNRDEEFLSKFEGIVMLDDIGSEKVTDWVAETFYLIVNRRYNGMLPTIFTSNFPLGDLSERIGDRTVSRIAEMCDAVELVGSDRRVKNQSKKTITL